MSRHTELALRKGDCISQTRMSAMNNRHATLQKCVCTPMHYRNAYGLYIVSYMHTICEQVYMLVSGHIHTGVNILFVTVSICITYNYWVHFICTAHALHMQSGYISYLLQMQYILEYRIYIVCI